MKVRDTKGKWHTWNLAECKVSRMDTTPRSGLHLKSRELLKSLFPIEQMLEEVPVPGEKLFIDFYLPMRKLAIEVHGEQHYKYVPHFHGHQTAFIASKQRDSRKEEWCRVNGITLIVLPFSEDINEWRNRIQKY
jgi:hypothetical protein